MKEHPMIQNKKTEIKVLEKEVKVFEQEYETVQEQNNQIKNEYCKEKHKLSDLIQILDISSYLSEEKWKCLPHGIGMWLFIYVFTATGTIDPILSLPTVSFITLYSGASQGFIYFLTTKEDRKVLRRCKKRNAIKTFKIEEMKEDVKNLGQTLIKKEKQVENKKEQYQEKKTFYHKKIAELAQAKEDLTFLHSIYVGQQEIEKESEISLVEDNQKTKEKKYTIANKRFTNYKTNHN
ncbi:MAG: hypothetical protein PHN72_03655 [Bacilli bacterium]|nr:hypothetical protein [Bacilli bacterium]